MYGWKTILSFWEGLVFKGELLVSWSVHLQLAHRRPHQLEVLVLKLVFSVWCDGRGPRVFGQIEKVGATGVVPEYFVPRCPYTVLIIGWVLCTTMSLYCTYNMLWYGLYKEYGGWFREANPRTVTLPRKVPTFSLWLGECWWMYFCKKRCPR